MKLKHKETVELLLKVLAETEFELKMSHAVHGCYLKVPDDENEYGRLLDVEYVFKDFYDDEIVSEVRLSIGWVTGKKYRGTRKRYRKIKLEANNIIIKVKELVGD